MCIEMLLPNYLAASDDSIVAEDTDADTSDDSQVTPSQRYSTRKKSLDTSQGSSSATRKGNQKTPDGGGDLPVYMTWFKDCLTKAESGTILK